MTTLTLEDAPRSYRVDVGRGEVRTEVSNEWFRRPHDERYLSLADLSNAVRDRWQNSETEVIDNRGLEFYAPEPEDIGDTHILRVSTPGRMGLDFSHWSFQQAASLAGAPASYMRTLPSQLVVDNLTWGITKNRGVEQVKVYYASDLGQMRAITGPTYGRIPDYEVVDAVRQIAETGSGQWKVPGCINWSNRTYDPHAPVTKESTTLFAGDRDIFIFLCDDLNPIKVGTLDDGSPDYMFRGFFVKQSEVGAGALVIAIMYLRGTCMNRCLWGVEGFEQINIRHTSGAPERAVLEAYPALKSYSEGSQVSLIEGVKAAKAAVIARDDEEAVSFLRKRGASKKRAKAILEIVEKEEGHPMRTVWDAANGLTAFARSIPHQDQRLEVEKDAGRLLDKVA